MTSYVISAMLIAVTMAMAVANVRKVTKNTERENLEIRDTNHTIEAMYELLKTQSKIALVYSSLFILRRLLLSLILVFMATSKVGQIVCLTIISLLQISYFLSVRPFEEPFLNHLEVFNEAIVLCSYYHLYIFTGGLIDDIYIIYIAGWSLDILLLVHFSVNIYCLS